MAELPLPAGLNASTFPAKLWRLVNSPRVRSVRWDSRGQGLLIDRSLLERELLSPGGALAAGGEGAGPAPDSFQATHFGSFVRQLNLYGFHKVPGETGGWLHFTNPSFRRDRPDLLLHIKRLTRANRQRLAMGLEVRSRQPSRFQQLRTERPLPAFSAGQPPRAAPSCQNLAAASLEGSELPPGPSWGHAGAQESEASPPPAKKVCASSGLFGASPVEPSRELFHQFNLHKLTIPLVCINPEAVCRTLGESSSCKSSGQHTPANDTSATPGTSAPSAPAGCAGYAPWRAPRWLWYTPGEEELPPLDLDLVLETLEEMLSSSPPERSPCAQGNIDAASESSGGEPENKAAAEGALPGTQSCGNSSQEPEELDIHLIYLARRAALRAKESARESL
ncbi:uncharacterized protein LOC117011206 [Catharus ustulatus]|nr:uncharacterized protein LOC117011206 [Catharus ustulatus]